MTTHAQAQTSSRHWWALGLALVSVVLPVLAPWFAVLQVVALVWAVYLLTQGPNRQERTVLIVAIVIVGLTLAVQTAGLITSFAVTGEFSGTSVPLG